MRFFLLALPVFVIACDSTPADTTKESADLPSDGEDSSSASSEHGSYLANIEMVPVRAGSFVMGSSVADDNTQPRFDEVPHDVELTGDFEIMTTEVTRAHFEAYMGYDPTYTTTMMACEDCPVHTVSWDESAAFANAMSAVHGLEACYSCDGDGLDVTCDLAMSPYECDGYRMPTEAEWEYAARGGNVHVYPGSNDIDAIGWWKENADWSIWGVALLEPNAIGLYDMGGNVREFVNDWHIDQTADPAVDPWVAPDDGSFPVEKGGSFACIPEHLEPNTRYMNMNGGTGGSGDFVRDVHVGFRVARSLR